MTEQINTPVDETEDEWDLADALVEREQPTDTVPIYLNEKASYLKTKLLESHAKATVEQVVELDKALDEVEAALEKTKYIIHLRAIPSRMREDISSKAMHEHPLKIDLVGRDDPANQIARMKLEQNMIWHAQITDVVNPVGKHRRQWTLEQMVAFCDSLPTKAQQMVDAAIKDLTVKAEQHTAKRSVDFS